MATRNFTSFARRAWDRKIYLFIARGPVIRQISKRRIGLIRYRRQVEMLCWRWFYRPINSSFINSSCTVTYPFGFFKKNSWFSNLSGWLVEFEGWLKKTVHIKFGSTPTRRREVIRVGNFGFEKIVFTVGNSTINNDAYPSVTLLPELLSALCTSANFLCLRHSQETNGFNILNPSPVPNLRFKSWSRPNPRAHIRQWLTILRSLFKKVSVQVQIWPRINRKFRFDPNLSTTVQIHFFQLCIPNPRPLRICYQPERFCFRTTPISNYILFNPEICTAKSAF